MGAMTKDNKRLGIIAYKNILWSFHSLNNIHGFIYFMIIFGEYLLTLCAEEGHKNKISKKAWSEDKVLYSDARIVKRVFGEQGDLVGYVILLRNAFAHWNVETIRENLDKLIYFVNEVSIHSIEDVCAEACISVLKKTDWNYMKSELCKISPELNLV